MNLFSIFYLISKIRIIKIINSNNFNNLYLFNKIF